MYKKYFCIYTYKALLECMYMDVRRYVLSMLCKTAFISVLELQILIFHRQIDYLSNLKHNKYKYCNKNSLLLSLHFFFAKTELALTEFDNTTYKLHRVTSIAISSYPSPKHCLAYFTTDTLTPGTWG